MKKVNEICEKKIAKENERNDEQQSEQQRKHVEKKLLKNTNDRSTNQTFLDMIIVSSW